MKVYGIGRLVRDTEERATTSGLTVANFTIAWDGIKNTSHFIRCVALGKTAEAIIKYFKKGDRIFISNGELTTNEYVNHAGDKVKFVDILVNAFEFVEKKERTTETPEVADEVENETTYTPESDEDLPF